MKVREALGRAANVKGVESKDSRRVVDSKNTSFTGQLTKTENENYEARIQRLVSGIVEQGEKLGKKVDIRELKVYKKLIAEFLDEAVGNSHKFSKQSFLDRRGRHRVYAIVRKVNKELELLTEDVLKNEKDNINILKRLDEIKGLVLDLIL